MRGRTLCCKKEECKVLTVVRNMHADRISTDCSELPLVALCAHGCLLSCVCVDTCTWVSLFRRGFLEAV